MSIFLVPYQILLTLYSLAVYFYEIYECNNIILRPVGFQELFIFSRGTITSLSLRYGMNLHPSFAIIFVTSSSLPWASGPRSQIAPGRSTSPGESFRGRSHHLGKLLDRGQFTSSHAIFTATRLLFILTLESAAKRSSDVGVHTCQLQDLTEPFWIFITLY